MIAQLQTSNGLGSLQEVAAMAVVLAAVGYLVRRAWLMLRANGKQGCGSGCGKCAAADAKEPQLVQIQTGKK